MRHRSFTLLETLVALSVIAMFISSGMNANRIIRRSSAERTERETMKMLALDSIRTFEAWRDWYVSQEDKVMYPTDQSSINSKLGYTSDSQAFVTGVFYGALPNSCDPLSDDYDVIDHMCSDRSKYGGPLGIRWCLPSSGNTCPNPDKIKLPVYATNKELLGPGGGDGQYVGVADTSLCPKVGENCTGLLAGIEIKDLSEILDVSNPRFDYGNNDKLEGYSISNPDTLPYALYNRTIKITKATPGDLDARYAAYIVEVTVNNRPTQSTITSKVNTHTEKALVIFTPSI